MQQTTLCAPSRQEARAGPVRLIRVLLLPPQPDRNYRDNFEPDTGSDPYALQRLLATHGIELTSLDPAGWPLNPLAGKHPMLEGMDPWRAVRVLLWHRYFDLVVSVMDGPAMPLLLLRRLVRFKTPIVMWDLAPAHNWRLRAFVQNFVIPRAAGIMTLTTAQIPFIASRWSPAPPVVVIGSLIDTGFYRPMDVPAGNYIFSIGQDVGRDHATLLAAVAGVPAELKLRTGRTLPAETGGMGNVTVLRERVPDRALRELYAASRFVVAPLAETTNANGVSTIQEAGAMGKALVVTDNPAIRDFIIPDETCLMVPCHDVAAMRGAMLRLLNDPALCERLGRNGRRFVEATASPAIHAARFAEAVRQFARRP
jgi:glycosyltransferase involved in cell wall biosynthesis